MNFYKIELVVEEDNSYEAEQLISSIIETSKVYCDVFINGGAEELTDKQILEVFGRTKEEMIKDEF